MIWVILAAAILAYAVYLEIRERREDEDDRAMHASVED